ncbi:UNVERIFIED_CONTAM: hypothetical protein RMT77_019719 [Armadillidium vulgare]
MLYSVKTDAMGKPDVGQCARRKRSLSLPSDLELNEHGSENLDTSLNSEDVRSKSAIQKRKFLVTLWSTLSSTLTVTTFVINRRVTLSASVACTIPNVILPKC